MVGDFTQAAQSSNPTQKPAALRGARAAAQTGGVYLLTAGPGAAGGWAARALVRLEGLDGESCGNCQVTRMW